MGLFGEFFCFYTIVFVGVGILVLMVRKRLEPRTPPPREEVALRTYAEIMEEKAQARAERPVEERTYVSPCLSCTKVIDPRNCTGCSVARPDPEMPERRAS